MLTHGKSNLSEIRSIIDEAGGRRQYLINWEWAYFADEAKGREVFERVKDFCEHRGFHEAQPEAENANLRMAAFRFR